MIETLGRFSEFFDRYNRMARLYPAVITSLPLCLTGVTLNPDLFVGDVARSVGFLLVACAGLALVSNIARVRGKAIEPALLTAGGGWRTTVVLRHRDTTIDQFTTARYHAALRTLCVGLTLPSPAEEAAAPAMADDLYRSATKRLIEARRDSKYGLLHKENAQYGFRRNLLGLKPIALFIIAAAIAVGGSVLLVGFTSTTRDIAGLFADASTRWSLYAVTGIDLFLLFVWLTLIRAPFVLQAADEYALALVRTLDD